MAMNVKTTSAPGRRRVSNRPSPTHATIAAAHHPANALLYHGSPATVFSRVPKYASASAPPPSSRKCPTAIAQSRRVRWRMPSIHSSSPYPHITAAGAIIGSM